VRQPIANGRAGIVRIDQRLELDLHVSVAGGNRLRAVHFRCADNFVERRQHGLGIGRGIRLATPVQKIDPDFGRGGRLVKVECDFGDMCRRLGNQVGIVRLDRMVADGEPEHVGKFGILGLCDFSNLGAGERPILGSLRYQQILDRFQHQFLIEIGAGTAVHQPLRRRGRAANGNCGLPRLEAGPQRVIESEVHRENEWVAGLGRTHANSNSCETDGPLQRSMRANPENDILQPNRLIQPIAGTLSLTLLASLISVLPVRAQEATPAAVMTCDVPARPISFIADLTAAPKPETTPTPVAGVPDGTEISDAEVRSDVVAVVETLIVCVNQGELLRSFSLFDDEYLRRLIDPDGLMRADVAVELAKSLATPDALNPDDVTVLDEVLTIRQLDDGTVLVVFRTLGGPDRDSDDAQIDLFILRKFDDQWLIVDGVTNIDPEALARSA
jgi:hypothetical protein